LPNSRREPEAFFAVTASLLLVLFIIGKMVGLEAISFGAPPFQFRLVASLLPFAMVFRRYGIAGIAVGCPLAHLLATGSMVNSGFAFVAAASGSVSSYYVFRKHRNSIALFVGTLLISLSWSVVFGVYLSTSTHLALLSAFSATLSSLWIGVNIIGFVFAWTVNKVSSLWGVLNA